MNQKGATIHEGLWCSSFRLVQIHTAKFLRLCSGAYGTRFSADRTADARPARTNMRTLLTLLRVGDNQNPAGGVQNAP